MSSVIDTLRLKLAAESGATRWCVAFSGGLDSTALLAALHELQQESDGIELRAIHVNHGLHADADTWAAQCAEQARLIGVPLEIHDVEVGTIAQEGMEAAARRARYQALEAALAPGELLMTAHHVQDQVETFLLRLMRGAGVRGLGSIAASSAFGPGRLVRPLLTVERDDLEAFVRAQGLSWVEDPSNRDTTIDRNYLRHEVVPALRRRWPGTDTAIGRSARLAAEAADLLHEFGAQDAALALRGELIDLPALRSLAPARQRNLVRHVLHERGLLPPSEAQLLSGLHQLLTAGGDRQPVLQWPGGQIRRYRDRLYVLAADPDQATADLPDVYHWDGRKPLELGAVRGRLRLASDDPAQTAAGDLTVRFRRGGERILEADQRHHKQLKKMFQGGGIVPWMRAHVPLVIGDGELLAVADLWSSAALSERLGPSSRLVWERHAAIR